MSGLANDLIGVIRQELSDHELPESSTIVAGLVLAHLDDMGRPFLLEVLAELVAPMMEYQDIRQAAARKERP